VNEATGNPLVDYALKFQGTPYEWGGNDLVNGIDCSGFVKQVMKGTIGYNLPRTAAEQALVGTPIRRFEDLRPGDRLYFRMRSESKISHTGIYMGNWRFVHSSHGKGGVSTDSLTKASWRNMLVAARR
jgi:cell wall-associated NlpC family hydrolase